MRKVGGIDRTLELNEVNAQPASATAAPPALSAMPG